MPIVLLTFALLIAIPGTKGCAVYRPNDWTNFSGRFQKETAPDRRRAALESANRTPLLFKITVPDALDCRMRLRLPAQM